MNVRILYFARLREQFGRAAEDAALPATVTRAGELIAWLAGRGEPWTSELAAGRAFRIAVNQDMADADTALAEGDEIALFPPVTGG